MSREIKVALAHKTSTSTLVGTANSNHLNFGDIVTVDIGNDALTIWKKDWIIEYLGAVLELPSKIDAIIVLEDGSRFWLAGHNQWIGAGGAKYTNYDLAQSLNTNPIATIVSEGK